MDIAMVDPAALVDIRMINIDRNLPLTERVVEYIRQIKNPYCYKCGKVTVNISFANTNETLEDRLESPAKISFGRSRALFSFPT